MRPAWPVMICVLAALAAVSARAHVMDASALRSEATEVVLTPAQVAPQADPAGFRADAWDDLAVRAIEAWQSFRAWTIASYERAPALVLGLAVLLVVPPLALLGLMIRGQADRSADATQIRTRRTPFSTTRRRGPSTESVPAWPSQAWLEAQSADARRHAIGRGVVRIGREDDNDICIGDMTVHRYHAAVHRTDDAEFVITDLSNPDGNGVLVNGQRVSAARLKDGDMIELGHARFKFVAMPA